MFKPILPDHLHVCCARAEAAEARAEALKEEQRRAPDASPAILQQHAAEMEASELRLEQLQVRPEKAVSSDRTYLSVCSRPANQLEER